MLLCIDLPFMNPDWLSLIIWGSPSLRQLENMCVNILLSLLRSVIGRQLLSILGSLSDFGIRTITPCLIDGGNSDFFFLFFEHFKSKPFDVIPEMFIEVGCKVIGVWGSVRLQTLLRFIQILM